MSGLEMPDDQSKNALNQFALLMSVCAVDHPLSARRWSCARAQPPHRLGWGGHKWGKMLLVNLPFRNPLV